VFVVTVGVATFAVSTFVVSVAGAAGASVSEGAQDTIKPVNIAIAIAFFISFLFCLFLFICDLNIIY
jgi:hypothetical protein